MNLKPLLFWTVFSLQAFALTSVKVSDFNPSPDDASEAFQSALDSRADVVLVDPQSFDYILGRTIHFHSNQEVVFQDKSRVCAKKGAFKGVTDVLMVADGVSNLVIRGEGDSVVKMRHEDYLDPRQYVPSQYRHLLVIVGCENVTIKGMHIAGSGGSGIYLSGNRTKPHSKNILVENVFSEDQNREACFVVSVEDLTIRNCRFVGTHGWPTELGIDFEPNTKDERLVDILVEDTLFQNNLGGGLGIGSTHILAKPVSCTVRNCKFIDNHRSAILVWPWGGIKGTVTFEKCSIKQKRNIPIQLTSFRKNGLQVHFKDCRLDNSKGNSPAIMISTHLEDDIDGIDFGNFEISQNPANPLFKVGELGAARLETPRGEITVIDGKDKSIFNMPELTRQHPGHPELRAFATLPCIPHNLAPVASTGSSANGLRLRGPQRFLQYAKGGEKMEILFTVPATMPTWELDLKVKIRVSDCNGKPVDKFLMDGRSYKYEFTPKTTGIYQFEFETYNSINVSSAYPGQGYDASRRFSLLGDGSKTGLENDLYFYVPADAEKVNIEVWGDTNEPVEAKLYNAKNELVAQTKYAFGVQMLSAGHKEAASAELWRIRVRGYQDHAIRLGTPLTPILFTSPRNALLSKERK